MIDMLLRNLWQYMTNKYPLRFDSLMPPDFHLYPSLRALKQSHVCDRALEGCFTNDTAPFPPFDFSHRLRTRLAMGQELVAA